MRAIIFSFLLVISTLFASARIHHLPIDSQGGCVIIDNNPTQILAPGDTILIDSATAHLRRWIHIENVHGTEKDSIVFINNGYVEMPAGFGFKNCSYVKLTGQGKIGGAKRNYGCGLVIFGYFKEKDQTGQVVYYSGSGLAGFSASGTSSHIAVEYIEFRKTKYGMQIKNDESCDTTLNYPNVEMKGFRLHHNYIHHTESQGFYIGSTEPYNALVKTRPRYNCDNIAGTYFFNPGRLSDFDIAYNRIEHTGRGGVQLALAGSGKMSRIHHNYIRYSGEQADDAQGGNITVGGHTACTVDSNDCSNALTWNIIWYGTWGQIFDNKLDSAGWTRHNIPDTAFRLSWGSNMNIATRYTQPVDSIDLWIFDNKLAHSSVIKAYPGSYSIGTEKNAMMNAWSTNNRIGGNTYDGKPIALTSPLFGKQPELVFRESKRMIRPRINAGRDLVNMFRLNRGDTVLRGVAVAMDGKKLEANAYKWSYQSGPGATIETATKPETAVKNLKPGIHSFRLTVTDNKGVSSYDEVMVEVSGKL